MKKEELELFKDEIPFKLILKDGTFYTVRELLELKPSSIVFKDKFARLQVIDYDCIGQVKEIQAINGDDGNAK